MKNMILLACAVLILAACKKPSLNPGKNGAEPNGTGTPYAVSLENDAEETRYDRMIETVAIGLLDAREDENFRTIVNEEVSKKFDGDDNALLLAIDNACKAHEMDLTALMEASLESHGRTDLIEHVSDAIHGFPYDNDKIYLQIYIPYKEEVNINDIPTIAENHEEGSVIKGYDHESSVISVNSEYAQGKLTWVVGGNESIIPGIHPLESEPTGPTEPQPPHKDDPFAYVVQVTELDIFELRESFPNGQAEIMCVSYHIGNGCNAGLLNMQFVNKYGRTGYYQNLSGPYFSPPSNPWLPGSLYNQKISVLWYERDVRKKFDRVENVYPGCNNTAVSYRSKEEKYGIQTIIHPGVVSSLGVSYLINYPLKDLTVVTSFR